MDPDLDESLDADAYDELVGELAAEAAGEQATQSRSDAVWDAVGDVVPQLNDDVCERIVSLADSEPRDALVEQVTAERGSGDAERRRAEALTALVADVEARIAEDEAA